MDCVSTSSCTRTLEVITIPRLCKGAVNVFFVSTPAKVTDISLKGSALSFGRNPAYCMLLSTVL